MHPNLYDVLLHLTSSVKGHLSTVALCVLCSADSLKIMRTYLKVIAQRIFGDGAWEEVSGNRLLFKCLSLFYQTLGKKKLEILGCDSLMIKITRFPGKTGSWDMLRSPSLLSKRIGLKWQLHMSVVYSATAGKVSHDQLRPYFFF